MVIMQSSDTTPCSVLPPGVSVGQIPGVSVGQIVVDLGVADTGRLLAVFTNGFAIHPHATPLEAEPGAQLPVPVTGSTISPVHSIICDFMLPVFALSSLAHSGAISARTIAGRIVGNIEERARRAQFAWRLGAKVERLPRTIVAPHCGTPRAQARPASHGTQTPRRH
jgi:hypothetical protein